MKNILAGLTFLFSVSAFASGGVGTGGGGGGGVEIGPSVYLLDLYNEGLHEKGDLAPDSLPLDAALWRTLAIDGPLWALEPSVKVALIKKISEFEIVDPYFAAAFVEALKILNWRFVDGDLLETRDLSLSESVDGRPVITLAVRQGQTISISKPKWLRMNLLNQTALLVHEVLAALAPPNWPADSNRRAVAKLFTTEFFALPNPDLQKETLRPYPSSTSVDALFSDRGWRRSHVYSRESLKGADATFRFDLLQVNELGDSRNVLEALLTRGKKFPIYTTDSVAIGSDYTRLCDEKSGPYQLLGFQVVGYRMKVKFAPLKNGQSVPNLISDLERATFFGYSFGDQKTSRFATCSPRNRDAMKEFSRWTKTIHPIPNYSR